MTQLLEASKNSKQSLSNININNAFEIKNISLVSKKMNRNVMALRLLDSKPANT